jgi:hypothetical protein
MMSSALRRQSRPLARIIRDFVLLKRPIVALAVGSAIFFGAIALTQERTNYDRQGFPPTQKVNKPENKTQ